MLLLAVFLVAACGDQAGAPTPDSAARLGDLEADVGTPPPPHPVATPAWLTPPPEASALDVARETMVAFFDHLSQGRYREAAALYGGSYTAYQEWNPDVPTDDGARLWEAVCTRQLPCLPVSRVLGGRALDDGTFAFIVAFVRRDGTLFNVGPCCGQTSGPLTWRFPITVVEREGKFRVVSGPVYGR